MGLSVNGWNGRRYESESLQLPTKGDSRALQCNELILENVACVSCYKEQNNNFLSLYPEHNTETQFRKKNTLNSNNTGEQFSSGTYTTERECVSKRGEKKK